jgi:hypothetical protein
MLSKPRIVDGAYVQAKYLENMDKKKGKLGNSKKKYHQDASKKGNKKWKGKDKKRTTTTH